MRNLEAISQMSQQDQHAGELKEAQTSFLRVTHDEHQAAEFAEPGQEPFHIPPARKSPFKIW